MNRRWGIALAASVVALTASTIAAPSAGAAGGVPYEVDTYATSGNLIWTLPMTDEDAIFTPFNALSSGTLGDVTLNFVNPSPDAVLRISMNRERSWNAVGPFPGFWIADETVAVGGKTSVTVDFSVADRQLSAGSEYTLAVSVEAGSVSLPLHSGGEHHEWLPLETRYAAVADGELAASVMVSGVDDDDPSVSIAAGPDARLGRRGWYTEAPVVTYTCSDPTSGVVDCPESEPLDVDGRYEREATVTDVVGHTSATATLTVKVDTTDPVVKLVPDRAPNEFGWYREPITVSTTATDVTSGVAAVSEPQSLGRTLQVNGGASDVAGNLAIAGRTFRIDQRAPTSRIVGIEQGEHFTTMPSWHVSVRDGNCDSCSGVDSGRSFADVVRLAKHRYRVFVASADYAGNKTREGVVFYVKR